TDFAANIRALAIHPDGRRVAIGLQDGTLLLRLLATSADVGIFHDHHASVLGVSFTADGSLMASVDVDGVVIIWQETPGGGWARLRTIRIDRPPGELGPEGYPSTLLALSSDGKCLVTYVPPQPRIVVWNAADGTQRATIDLPGPGQLLNLA